MSQKFDRRGLTLVELILAILLVNVVILTGLSMEMGMRKIFTGTDITSELNNEAAVAMTFVTKVINRAIGAQAVSQQKPAYAGFTPYSVYMPVADGSAWSILQDTNGNGIPEPGVDIRCAFRYFTAGANQGQVWYYNDVANINLGLAPTFVLATHCVVPASPGGSNGFSISSPTTAGNVGYSTVILRLRRDILLAVGANNPELYFVTKAQYLSTSFS